MPKPAPITGKDTICAGAVEFYNTTATGGVWSSSNTAVATISQTPALTGVSAGTTTIYYTINDSRISCSSSKTVVVLPQPAAPTIVPANGWMCSNGGTVQLSTTSTGGVWKTFDNATNITVNPTTGLVTSVIDVQVTTGVRVWYQIGQCQSEHAMLGIMPKPAPITGANSVCKDGTLQLTCTTPNGVWSSSNTTIATVDGNGVVTGVAAGTVTIFYSINDPRISCSSSKQITIDNGINVAPIQGNLRPCAPSTTTLTCATPNGLWSCAAANATINQSGVLNITAAGPIRVFYTVFDNSGCTGYATANIIASAKPVVAAIQGPTSVCLPGTAQYTCATPGGVWSSSNISIVGTINQNGLFTTDERAGTTRIEYVVTNANGCSDTARLWIAIKYSTSSTTNVTICSTDAPYTWNGNNYDSTGTYIVHLTNANGCDSAATLNLTVNKAVTPLVKIIASSDTGCWTKTVTFTAQVTNGGTAPTFQWYRNGLAVGGNSTTYTDSYIWPGTRYSVFMNANNACQTNAHTSDHLEMYLDSGLRPSVSIAASANPICSGSLTTITATTINGGASPTYKWFINGTETGGNVSSYSTASLNNSDRIMCIIFANNACQTLGSTSSNQIVMQVLAKPTVAAIQGDNAPCVGTSTTLTCTTPNGVWSCNGSNAVIFQSGNLYINGPGSFTVYYTVTDANGCSNYSSFVVLPKTLPTVAAIQGNATPCVGSTTTLTCATAGGVWSCNGTNAVINQNGELTVTGTGSFTVYYTITGANGCVNKAILIIVPNAKPTVAAITGNFTPCVGSTTTLACTTPNGVWSNNGTNAVINQNGELTVVGNGSFTVYYTVTNANGCTNYASQVIAPNPKPTAAAIQGDNAPCVGTSTTLTCATPNGVWSCNGSNAVIFQSGNLYINDPGSFTVYYTVTDANGCSNYSSFVVVPKPLPTVAAIQGNATPCVGTTTILTCATGGGVWSCNGTNAVINQNGELTVTGTGSFTVYYTITGANGCVNKAILIIVPNAKPTVNAINGGNSVCVGKNITYTNTTSGGLWSSSNTTVATINSAGVLTGVAAGTTEVRYTVTNAQGCIAYQSINCTVTTATIPAITGGTTVCVGSSITLANAQTGGVWSSLNNKATVSSVGVATGANAGTASIQYAYTNANGCVATATYSVTVNAIPNMPSISYASGTPLTGPQSPQYGAPAGSYCTNKTFTVVGNPTGGVWSKTGVISVDITTGVVNTGSVSGSGSLTYTITVSGCSNSRTTSGNVVSCASKTPIIDNSQEQNDILFTLYPNPASSKVNISTDKFSGNGLIIISDVYGKTIREWPLSIGTNTIDIQNLSKGFYFVTIISNEKRKTKKLVVE